MALTFGDLYARLTSAALDEIRGRIRPPASIVDFGAGCGRLSIPLAAEGYLLTAVEPSPAMLGQLRTRTGDRDVNAVECTMQEYRSDRKHDLALCVFTVVAYLLDERALRAALSAAAQSLRPGGLFLLDVPDASVFEGFDHDSGDIMRRVEIASAGASLYQFNEETTLRTDDGPQTYRDSFPIRHWRKEEILGATEQAGFVTEADVTARFEDLGAEYLLLRLAG